MTISRKFLLCLLSVAALAFVACTDDNGGDNGGGGDVPTEDIVDKVSQYEARKFDGEKRAGVFYEIFVRSFAEADNRYPRGKAPRRAKFRPTAVRADRATL